MVEQFAAQASGTFDATGQNVVETAATGTVTFTSGNTGDAVTIPAGTQVETASGIAFATNSAVTVPKATHRRAQLTFTPSTADVAVTAVKKGLAGNVAAAAIVNVPAWLAADLGVADQVTNQKATSGGTHTVTPFVQQSDIDAAEASLATQLDSAAQAEMADPSSVAAGFELFPKTAHMGDTTFDPDPATLLNQGVPSFDLAATGTETATEVDLSIMRSLADRKVQARVQDGHALVAGSVEVAFGSPTAQGAAVSVPVVAGGLQTAVLDVDQLRAAIKGKSAAAARAYLSQYGDAQVSLSPFWVSTISGFDFRIDVRLVIADVAARPHHGRRRRRLSGRRPRQSRPRPPDPPLPTGSVEPTGEPTPPPSSTPSPSVNTDAGGNTFGRANRNGHAVSGNDGGRGAAPNAGRVLGIDLGERRIGVALGEVQTRSALPLATLSRARSVEEDARVVARLAAEQRVDALVVGLPLNADGSEGPQAARTREWAVAVAAATGLPLRFRDERLTSVRAEQRVGGPVRGRSGGPPSARQRDAHRARIDREAAVLILQDELDAMAGPDESAPAPAAARSEEPNESA